MRKIFIEFLYWVFATLIGLLVIIKLLEITDPIWLVTMGMISHSIFTIIYDLLGLPSND